MTCSNCGTVAADDAKFCAQCGAPLPEAPQASTPAGPSGFDRLPSAETTRTFAPISADGLPPAAAVEPAEDAGEAELQSVEGLPPDTALLVVKRGPNAGSRFLLDQEVTTAGRHPGSDIFLDDVTVSRRHAEFRRDGAQFTVHDVGSLNGTYLNREIIDSAALVGGDEVQIGKFRLIFLTGHRVAPDVAVADDAAEQEQ